MGTICSNFLLITVVIVLFISTTITFVILELIKVQVILFGGVCKKPCNVTIITNNEKCTEFANYVLENYIDTEQFPPLMWAEEPNGTKRTTNGAESYHSRLRFEFYMPHPSVFQVIDVLIDQQVINEAKMREIKKGTEAIQRKCNREQEANLVYQYSLLLTNKLTVMEYIEKTGLHFKPI